MAITRMANRVQINLRLTPEMRTQLRKAVFEQDKPANTIIEEALEFYFRKQSKRLIKQTRLGGNGNG